MAGNRNEFHHEQSVLVASSAVTFSGAVKYIEKHISELVLRGASSKPLILTGSHGEKDGTDGLNSLECLSNGSETRDFYA